MAILKSSITPRDAKFKANAEAMGRLTAELAERRATAALGGDQRSRDRHVN
jgi:3-methylcrotonyl-CoA carboxylase beta subunit